MHMRNLTGITCCSIFRVTRKPLSGAGLTGLTGLTGCPAHAIVFV